jgi:hypothetical protein
MAKMMSVTGLMWLLAFLLPVLTFVGQNMCVWSAPRSLGDPSISLLYLSVLTVLMFLAAVLASIYLAVSGVFQRGTPGELSRRISRALACLTFMGLWILAIGSARSLRHRAFDRASHAGNPIVQALAQYRHEKGHYPESLDQLVPGYLPRIPFTGLIGYPEFVYNKDRHANETRADTYELAIFCPSAFMNFDRFFYWPSETYPDYLANQRVERIGTWAYLHE